MKKTCAALILLSFAIASCSTFKSEASAKTGPLKTAKTAPRIKVPAGLNANGMRDRFPVPPRHYSDGQKNVELEAPQV